MYKLFNVMAHKSCKDSLTQLMEMPYAVFHELELYLYIDSLCDAERLHTQRAMTKK